MVSSSASDSSQHEDEATHLQPCFVLRRASPETVSSSKGLDSSKSKRKIEFAVGVKGNTADSTNKSLHSLPPFSKDEHALYGKWRMEAFTFVWSRIENIIKDVLLELSTHTFEEIQRWICDSFFAAQQSKLYRSLEAKNSNASPCSPVVKQLATALVFIIGKHTKIHLIDIFCDALFPLASLDQQMENGGSCSRHMLRNGDLLNNMFFDLCKGKFINLAIRKIREYLIPMEAMPFHEILCFKHVSALQQALMGDTRKTIQNDLLNSQSYLQCRCCKGLTGLSSSMHDTSIAARFSKAIAELQIVGLLRMPSKRRPDYVQRVALVSNITRLGEDKSEVISGKSNDQGQVTKYSGMVS